MHTFKIVDLEVSIESKKIIQGVSLTVKSGELHVVMGPNGSGKSTLTYGLMGSPSYLVSAQKLYIDKVDLSPLSPEDRAKAGLMLAFQNPIAVPGVTLMNLLKTAYQEMYPKESFSVVAFYKKLRSQAEKLGMKEEMLKRGINDGFSGGEKKKVEMLQLLTLKPKFVLLDEIDTGLDVDALKIVSSGIQTLLEEGSGVILITHYQRILNYLKPQFVHIIKSGKTVLEGGPELVTLIEEKGYGAI